MKLQLHAWESNGQDSSLSNLRTMLVYQARLAPSHMFAITEPA